MRIAVIGAGVIGVTTAFELASDGHEVCVFERRGSAAVEASFANAGLVAPASTSAFPWSSAGLPARWRSDAFAGDPSTRQRPRLSLHSAGWLWRWWRAARAPAFRAHQAQMLQLGTYSRERLLHLTESLGLDYERAQGHLWLLRSARESAAIEPLLQALEEHGLAFERCSPQRSRLLEPGLDANAELHEGIYLPGDEVGNCRQFSLLMRAAAEQRGVRFRFHSTVQALQAAVNTRPVVVSLHKQHDDSSWMPTGSEQSSRAKVFEVTRPLAGPIEERFDAVMVCAAAGARQLLAPLGLNLPLASLHGQSITAPIRHHEAHPDIGPRSAVTDWRHQVVITRLGDRLRVSGGAQLGPRSENTDTRALERLYKALNDWFPGAARLSQVQRWRGTSTGLPDGPPMLGSTGVPGVWLNLGHGAAGWTQACGSARLLSDAVSGRSPAIDTQGLGYRR